jgi:tRNA-splicing ligase RtcB
MQETFGSVCHGAGRLMSRTAAKKGRNAREVQERLEQQGILVRSETRDGILEEVPEAYKNVDQVIEVVHAAGLARKVARLRPMAVIKGLGQGHRPSAPLPRPVPNLQTRQTR